MMDDTLHDKWMDEEVEDVQKCLALYGAIGLLSVFEDWLKRKGHIKSEDDCKTH